MTDDNYYPRICYSASNSNKLTMIGQIDTPLYMTPELFEWDGHYDPSFDASAFSILTFEIVASEIPLAVLGEFSSKMAKLIATAGNRKRKAAHHSHIYFQWALELHFNAQRRRWRRWDQEQRKLKEETKSPLNKKLEEELNELKKKLDSQQISSDLLLRRIDYLWGNSKKHNPEEGVSYFEAIIRTWKPRFVHYRTFSTGMFEDFKHSTFYYERLASQWNNYNKVRFEICYRHVYGVECDKSKAIKYYKIHLLFVTPSKSKITKRNAQFIHKYYHRLFQWKLKCI